MQVRHPEYETKGIWFIAGQSYLKTHLDAATFDALLKHVPERFREAVESPLPSMWYPEDAAAHFLRAWLDVAADGDRTEFARMVAEGSEQGVGRFFRAISRVASGRFMLRQTPTIFKQLRRGPAHVSVEDRGDLMAVHYRHFPFFEDTVYTSAFPAQLGALLHVATGRTPPTEILGHTSDSLTVGVRL